MAPRGFNAILLAGQRPGSDALAAAFGQPRKALIAVAGQPMLSRVARTLAARDEVRAILVLAQAPDALLAAPGCEWMADDPRIAAVACGDSICQSIIDTLAARPDGWPWLVTTADNVLLTQGMIDDFVAGAQGAEVAAAVVERRTLFAAFPDSRRTWLRFRGGAYSGANLFWLGAPGAIAALAAWRRIEQARKKARAVLGAFGWVIPLLAALRLLTLEGAAARAGRRLGLRARTVTLGQAEACIDVDKPGDHALAERILSTRDGSA